MACRRRARHRPRENNNVEQLAFKYMMCRVESSTGSDSEISPRWSDTSTMGCASSAPESSRSRRVLPPGRHSCSLFLDPYDGSSEDSEDGDGRRTRTQGRGGCRFSRRSRRVLVHQASGRELTRIKDPAGEPPLEVEMRAASEPELCELLSPGHLEDSGVTSDLTVLRQSSSSEISPQLRSEQKRKLLVSGESLLQHKRRCLENETLQ